MPFAIARRGSCGRGKSCRAAALWKCSGTTPRPNATTRSSRDAEDLEAPGPAPRAPGGTEAAIRADERLTEEQKKALIGVYRSFVDRAPAGT